MSTQGRPECSSPDASAPPWAILPSTAAGGGGDTGDRIGRPPRRERLVAVADNENLYAFAIDRLTERPEVADVRTSVLYEHLRNNAIAPATG